MSDYKEKRVKLEKEISELDLEALPLNLRTIRLGNNESDLLFLNLEIIDNQIVLKVIGNKSIYIRPEANNSISIGIKKNL